MGGHAFVLVGLAFGIAQVVFAHPGLSLRFMVEWALEVALRATIFGYLVEERTREAVSPGAYSSAIHKIRN
jgi:hypothetical protein